MVIKDEVKFTFNFGVYSDLLGKFVDFDYDTSKVPDVWSCHLASQNWPIYA